MRWGCLPRAARLSAETTRFTYARERPWTPSGSICTRVLRVTHACFLVSADRHCTQHYARPRYLVKRYVAPIHGLQAVVIAKAGLNQACLYSSPLVHAPSQAGRFRARARCQPETTTQVIPRRVAHAPFSPDHEHMRHAQQRLLCARPISVTRPLHAPGRAPARLRGRGCARAAW
jgi:hypothetical protein